MKCMNAMDAILLNQDLVVAALAKADADAARINAVAEPEPDTPEAEPAD